VGILITHPIIFQNGWSPGSRLSSVLIHWYFFHSVSWLVIDVCRRVTSAFTAGFLMICHSLLNRIFGLFHPEYEPVIETVGHLAGDTWV
jgi:hypothetical protein